MQKLLSRSPSGPLLCSASKPPPFLAGFKLKPKPNPNFHKRTTNTSSTLGFQSKPSFFSQPAMPASAAAAISFQAGCSGSAFTKNPTTRDHSSSGLYSVPRCRICRCSISIQNAAPAAPSHSWIVFKEGYGGPRVAWLHESSSLSFAAASASAAGGGESTENTEKVVKSESISEERAVRVHRRSREGEGALAANPDLLTIPGVGPRNFRKLVDKGIEGVAQLKKLYKDKFFGKANEKMVEYLQTSVGIIHKNHAESITTYIKESVEEELKDCDSDSKPASKKRLTFCVEGNISVGKTTFLQRIANETLELRDLVEVVPEPINKWQDVGPDHFNVLDAFYADPQRYAYTFQNYVFVTRVMQERESSGGIKPLRLMERSVFSDRMVFVRAVHEAKWMNEMEISIYDSWFDPVVSSLPGLIPDGFIYLRASPDTCLKRMKLRKRAEEGGVTLEYLCDLHEKHESWLFPFQSGNHGVLSVSKPITLADSSLHPEIRDRVFYLEGNHMHSSIQKVPALVLDCEPNIDFSKDIEAKRQYASQVARFFEFVKKKKEVPSSNIGGATVTPPQVIMPQKGAFWMPDGKAFPESALGSLEFRRAMSFMSGQ